MHGRTSNIQKIALIGNNKDVSCLHRYASQPASPLKSAGLLDLIYLNASAEETEEGHQYFFYIYIHLETTSFMQSVIFMAFKLLYIYII